MDYFCAFTFYHKPVKNNTIFLYILQLETKESKLDRMCEFSENIRKVA